MTERAFVLAQVTTQDLVELGARVRRCAEEVALGGDAIARRVVDEVWRALGGGSPSGLALVRMYRTVDLAGVRHLALVATRGIEPAWNDVARSAHHRLLAVDGEPATLAPMVRKLVADLALAPRDRASAASELFYIAEAIDSPDVPAQREFVLRYGVRSVVAGGGPLPGNTGFALVVFTRVRVLPELATALGTIATQAGLALAEANDLDAPPAELAAFRARALDRVLRFAELVLIRRTTLLDQDLAGLRARLVELERELGAAAERHARGAQRAQRGMLNVIEDLREARTALERRVRERTADLERANDELRSTNAELEQFAYVASHDLQEPLRTIAGYLQLIQERYGQHLDAEGHEFIGFAISGAQRLQELIEALLAYSRVARAPFEAMTVSLERALDEALEATARAVAESGAMITRGPLPDVRGDPVQLRQLFQNLLSNAIKFRGAQPPRIEIAARRDDGVVSLTVRDHGVGFDPRYADQIFKVFRRLQRKQPGTGIGLAICKKIAERHGGSIRATSRPGDGATVEVTLPAGIEP